MPEEAREAAATQPESQGPKARSPWVKFSIIIAVVAIAEAATMAIFLRPKPQKPAEDIGQGAQDGAVSGGGAVGTIEDLTTPEIQIGDISKSIYTTEQHIDSRPRTLSATIVIKLNRGPDKTLTIKQLALYEAIIKEKLALKIQAEARNIIPDVGLARNELGYQKDVAKKLTKYINDLLKNHDCPPCVEEVYFPKWRLY